MTTTFVPATLQTYAEGVAAQIATLADSALNIAWIPTGSYGTAQVGIYMATVPSKPDKVIVLSPRQLAADPTLTDATYALQVRLRGTADPRVVWSLRDAVKAVILGRWPTTLPNGLEVRSVEYNGGTTLGQDASQRIEWSENFIHHVGDQRARPY